MEDATTMVAARNFVRSLNILLKTVRLYGADHDRTNTLFGTAWEELRTTLRGTGEGGVLLGISGTQILLDGMPLERRPTDKSFAQLFSAAGIASIHFSSHVTPDDFHRFVQAFASRSPKAGALMTELRSALGLEHATIRVNEVRFVPQDSALGEPNLAAQLAARALGEEAQKLQSVLEDPQRLLQLIVAAESVRAARGRGPGGAQDPTALTLSLADAAPVKEEDVLKVLSWLGRLGEAASHPNSIEQIGHVKQQLSDLPTSAQAALAQGLKSLGSAPDPARPDTPMLVQLAERVAIRFALQRFEGGETKVNAVVELLGRLKREVTALRKIVKGQDEKLGRAGLDNEAYEDILDRQFWAGVPERHKMKILLSPEAWAIPPRNIRSFVQDLLVRRETETARKILENYAACAGSPDATARRKVAIGLTDLADLYSQTHTPLLKSALHDLGEQLNREPDSELQTLLSAAFVRFSHEAAAQRHYPAVEEALVELEKIGERQPGLAKLLWPRIKVGNPLPEFIEEAARATQIPEGLLEVLRRTPQVTTDLAANCLPRCSRRDEWDRLVELVEGMGSQGTSYLRKVLEERPASEAAFRVALLCRLEPSALENLLPQRLREWDEVAHDQVVRQLAYSGASNRGKLLASLYDSLHPAVRPEALDEMGMCGDRAVASTLMTVVQTPPRYSAEAYLQIKAIEALGRLREPRTEALLRPLVEAKRLWWWKYPRELRITAAQALQKIDPDWAARVLPQCGLSKSDLRLAPLEADASTPWLRSRRYERLNLSRPLRGAVSSTQGSYPISVGQLSLGGGVAHSQFHIKAGSTAGLNFQSGLHRIRSEVLVREAKPQELTFELVKIGLADRNQLRRSCAGLQAALA